MRTFQSITRPVVLARAVGRCIYRQGRSACLFIVALSVLAGQASAAEVLRALPPGELPKDSRLGALKDLDGYFPFTPLATREAWAKRAEELRMQMRVALGIWPEPARTPLRAVIRDRVERDDYAVEKVYFEAMPGFFVTGTLFRPTTPGPHPAVLCPHGHWKDARFALRTDAEMKKELETGGERFLESGRSMFQSLGVQLARMGIVAFVYDMLGYCDSRQISFNLAHRFAHQRPEMNAEEGWGLFSPQAEAHAQSVMGLQTWNSIRAVDLLSSLPDVDPTRIGCTGASGGGTQTMILAALDPRITVECPAVMVSTAMQGGCTCENASLLRVETGNVEFAALFAPKPLGMTAANDWTKELETKGFPDLQRHFRMMGAPANVALWPHLQFGHNYNIQSRENIYAWFNEHFDLGLPAERLREREYQPLSKEELTVWDEQHPLPESGEEFERGLLRWWAEDAEGQVTKSAADFARICAPAWRAIVGWNGDASGAIQHERALQVAGEGRTYRARIFTCRNDGQESELPEIEIIPEKGNGRSVLWLDDRGKAGLFTAAGAVRPEVAGLLAAGWKVRGVDLFEQGEFLADGVEPAKARVVSNPRESAAYTLGYNRALFAQRARDICFALARQELEDGRPGSVAALDGTGPLAAAALAVFSGKIDSGVLQTGGFRFGKLLDWQSPQFLPAAAKYGDLPGALTLARARTSHLLVLGETEERVTDPLAWLIAH